MSETGHDILARSSTFYVDGTFSSVEGTFFGQLLMVLGDNGLGQPFPCLFALLPDKEKTTYQKLAEYLQSVLNHSPEVLMTDYERGLYEAFRLSFPNVLVRGCSFHWQQMIKQRIATDGLQTLLNSNMEFELFVHTIWTLLYVKQEELVTAWDTVVKDKLTSGLAVWEEKYFDGIKSFVKYFDRHFIGEKNNRTGGRKCPLIPVEQWNMFDAVRTGSARTNNAMEGYNHAFSLSLPKRASVWSLIDRFKAEESLMKKTFLDLATAGEKTDNSNRTLGRIHHEERLFSLVSNVNKMSLSLYMEAMVGLFNG